jgi:peptide deformylase
MTILQYPHEKLREKCEPVLKVTKEIKKIAKDMLKTLERTGGIGLAASQVGITKRIIVISMPEKEENERKRIIMINPEIIEEKNKTISEEGCLSLPKELKLNIERFEKIKVKGINIDEKEEKITAYGLLSFVFQHEIDHLNGVLIIDRVSLKERIKLIKFLDELMKK